jgi:hypothetical protein
MLLLGFDCLVVGPAGFPASPSVLGNVLLDTAGIEEVMHDVLIVVIRTPRAGVLLVLDKTHGCRC